MRGDNKKEVQGVPRSFTIFVFNVKIVNQLLCPKCGARIGGWPRGIPKPITLGTVGGYCGRGSKNSENGFGLKRRPGQGSTSRSARSLRRAAPSTDAGSAASKECMGERFKCRSGHALDGLLDSPLERFDGGNGRLVHLVFDVPPEEEVGK